LEKALAGPELPLVFKEEKVALDVPKHGCILHEEWKLFPTIPPKVKIPT